MKQEVLGTRFSHNEVVILKALAKQGGVSVSVIVRGLVRSGMFRIVWNQKKKMKDKDLLKLIKQGEL